MLCCSWSGSSHLLPDDFWVFLSKLHAHAHHFWSHHVQHHVKLSIIHVAATWSVRKCLPREILVVFHLVDHHAQLVIVHLGNILHTLVVHGVIYSWARSWLSHLFDLWLRPAVFRVCNYHLLQTCRSLGLRFFLNNFESLVVFGFYLVMELLHCNVSWA